MNYSLEDIYDLIYYNLSFNIPITETLKLINRIDLEDTFTSS
jgi:hypothetical protein